VEVPTTSGEIECCRYCEEIIRSRAKDVGQGDYNFMFDLRSFKMSGASLHAYFNLSGQAVEATAPHVARA
jgi:hypothetical protein